MEYRDIAGVIYADGTAVAGWVGDGRYRIGPDVWDYGHDSILDRLHADVGATRWMHATRITDHVWYVATPSGAFELRRRVDIAPSAYELVGEVAFGRLDGAAGGSLVVPPAMPVAEAVFSLWAARRITEVSASGAAVAAATTSVITGVAVTNAVNSVTIASRF